MQGSSPNRQQGQNFLILTTDQHVKSEQCVYPLKDALLQFASDHEQHLAEQATVLLDDSATLETPSGYA